MADPDLFHLYAECVRNAGSHTSCDEFFRWMQPVFRRVASRLARQFNEPGEIDDVVQEIGLKLVCAEHLILKSIPREPGSTTAYFTVVAANTARDYFRARNCSKRAAYKTVPLELWTGSGFEVTGSMEWELFFVDVERCLPKDRREQTVFRLYYRQGFSAKEIAALPAVRLGVKGVESMISRVASHVRDCMGRSKTKGNRPGQSL